MQKQTSLHDIYLTNIDIFSIYICAVRYRFYNTSIHTIFLNLITNYYISNEDISTRKLYIPQ